MPTPVLELGDDQVFVRPLTEGECAQLMVGVRELDISVKSHVGGGLVVGAYLLLVSRWLGAVFAVGVLASLFMTRRRLTAQRRELAEGKVLEVRSARRRLRVLSDSGRLIDPRELSREGEAR